MAAAPAINKTAEPRHWCCGKLRLLVAADGGMIVGSDSRAGRASIVLRGVHGLAFASAILRACGRQPSFGALLPEGLQPALVKPLRKRYTVPATKLAGSAEIHVIPNPANGLRLAWRAPSGVEIEKGISEDRCPELCRFLEAHFGTGLAKSLTSLPLEQYERMRRKYAGRLAPLGSC